MNASNLCRLATPQEIDFYTNQLYPLQDRVFKVAEIYGDRIYLTGGTALSRFYFQHRLSEDLDFFTTSEDLTLIIRDLIRRLEELEIAIAPERIEPYFARIMAIDGANTLKIDLVREPVVFGDLIKTPAGIYINNLADLGANKVSAYEDRAAIKDIIDLYFITQRHSWEELFQIADTKRNPIPYEHLLMVNAGGVKGGALLLKEVSAQEINEFCEIVKEKTTAEIKKKTEIAIQNLSKIIGSLLWDFPPEHRIISRDSKSVILSRLHRLSLPKQQAIRAAILHSTYAHWHI